MTAGAGGLAIVGTDLDRVTQITVECETLAPGAITLSAYQLADIVKGIPAGARIKLETVEDGARLVAGQMSLNLQTLPVADFPLFERDQAAASFEVGAQDLRRLLDKTAFAISTEETRYYLNGVYFHLQGADLRAVSTDGHRLAISTLKAPKDSEGMPAVIIPRLCVAELLKIISKKEAGAVRVEVAEKTVTFEVAGYTLMSKTIDGSFPDYNRVIPQGDFTVNVDKDSLAGIVSRVLKVGSERKLAINLAFEAGKLTVSTRNPNIGEVSESMACQWDYASPFEIGFNGRYLVDILAHIDGAKAAIRFSDDSRVNRKTGESYTVGLDARAPVKFPDGAQTFVLMPIRV
jgi:DNA polymerase-3 subunit beta